jgi:hypothetical protein
MSIFGNVKNNENQSPGAKAQEDRDAAIEKAKADAVAKANKNPVDAHGNPMPDLNAPAREEAKANAKKD